MKTIGISEFKELINARLANPSAYVGKTLVLWNSTANDYGIAYRVIEECCVTYNQAHIDDHVWYKEILDMIQIPYAITSKAFCERDDMYGYKDRGILLDSGIISLLKASDEEILQWLKFINNHEYQGKTLSSEWAMIACVQAKDYGFTEDIFSEDCILYELKPSVDEWAEWMKGKCDERDLKPLVAFIKEKKPSIDFSYWNLALGALEGELIDNDYEVLSQLSHDDFEGCLRSCLGFKVKGFPYDELWEFIQGYPL